MANDNQNRRYVKIGMAGKGKKQSLRESIEKDYRIRSLKDEYMSDIARSYRTFKQDKAIINLDDEPKGPQMD